MTFNTVDTAQYIGPGTLFTANKDYTKFIGGDSYTVDIKSPTVTNGRTLIIVKDSYGDALAPFLIGSFQEIWVVDVRYFKLNLADFAAAHGATDVCFCMSAFAVCNKAGDISGMVG